MPEAVIQYEKKKADEELVEGISVIIPTYNYAHYLTSAIDSALAQSYKNVEVIVVNDGSTDETAELAMAYGDRIRYIYQDNAGLSAARNKGIEEARFRYVSLLDADDVWLPDMLERLMETMQELPDTYGLVACSNDKIGKDGEPLLDKERIRPNMEITGRHLILKNQFMPSAVLVKKSLFSKVGHFDTDLRSSEDRDMWIRISKAARIWLIPDQLVFIRKHGNNMSKNADRMFNNMKIVIAKSYSNQVIPKSDIGFWLQVKCILNYQVSWIYHDQQRIGIALLCILRSFLYWPFWLSSRNVFEPPLFRVRALYRFVISGMRLWLAK